MYRRDEIINKHGQYIAYWSKQLGNTELDKFLVFESQLHGQPNNTQYIVPDNNGNTITCIVINTKGSEGYMLVCFNHLGETILNIDDCSYNDIYSVEESLQDHNLI